MFIHIYIYICTHICINIYIYTYVYSCTYINLYVYTYTYIYTYIHTYNTCMHYICNINSRFKRVTTDSMSPKVGFRFKASKNLGIRV